MKKIDAILGMLILAAFLSVAVFQTNSFAKDKPTPRTQHVTLQVSGMMCSNCSKSLESNLNKLKGAENVTADYSTGCASFDCPASAKVTKAQLKQAVADAGFTLKEVKFTEKPLKAADLKEQSQ